MTYMYEYDFEELESKIGFTFKNKDLLKEALTHRSYLNEYPRWPVRHNERLEYLGDAVLELIVSEELFSRFPDSPEGQLTVIRAALVNYQILARIAAEFDLEKHIFMSKGERGDNQRAKEVILANTFESLVGAIYLDQGFVPTKQFIARWVFVHTDEIVETKSYKDAKSELQELIQEEKKLTPNYRVLGEEGPAHAKIFTVGVFFGDELIAKGAGNSKQEAEVSAAKVALQKLKTG